jgi:hypothetical protein
MVNEWFNDGCVWPPSATPSRLPTPHPSRCGAVRGVAMYGKMVWPVNAPYMSASLACKPCASEGHPASSSSMMTKRLMSAG